MAALGSSPEGQAAGWAKGKQLSNSQATVTNCDASATSDGDSEMLAAWCGETSSSAIAVFTAHKQPGQAWSDPVLLSTTSASSVENVTVSYSGGEWLAVHVETVSSRKYLVVSTSSDGESWSVAHRASSGPSVLFSRPVVSESDGNWVVAYKTSSGSIDVIQAASGQVGDQSSWSSDVVTVSSTPVDSLDLEAHNGEHVVMWRQQDSANGYYALMSSSWTSATTWSSPVTIRPSTSRVNSFDSKFNPDSGYLELALSSYSSSFAVNVVSHRVRISSSSWIAMGDVSTGNYDATSPQLLHSSETHIAWRENSQLKLKTRVATWLSSPEETAPVTGGTLGGFNLDTTTDGDLVAVWSNYSNSTLTHVPEVAFRRISTGWETTAETLSSLDMAATA